MSRKAPHNLEAEQAVLGAVLGHDPSANLANFDRLTAQGLRSKHFFRPQHAALWDLVEERVARGEPVDLVALPEAVLRSGREARVGGLSYLHELQERVPSLAGLEHYARDVMADARRRQLAAAIEGATDALRDGRTDPSRVVADLGDRLAEADDARSTPWVGLLEALDDAAIALEEGEGRDVISTGYPALDGILGGLGARDLVVVAGRPAMGKSALAQNIAENAAMAGHLVLMYQLEMERTTVAQRFMSRWAPVDSSSLRRGELTTGERRRVTDVRNWADGRVQSFYLVDSPNVRLSDIAATTRRFIRQVGTPRLLIIDYLQLIEVDAGESREREVAALSRGLKLMAKELGCTVMILAQVNRECEKRVDKRPLPSDLRESGSIEQDADQILLTYRPIVYEPTDESLKYAAEVIVAKNRHGPVGTADLAFDARYTRFRTVEAEPPRLVGEDY